MGQNIQNAIPFEVKLEDGCVTNDMPTVLNRWKTEFSNLLNPNSEGTDPNMDSNVPNNNTYPAVLNEDELNGIITYDELIKLLKMQAITKHRATTQCQQKF